MKNTLSPKKKRFVDFIEKFVEERGYPPTFVEIANGLNISSLGTINWYVNALESDGIIERIKGKNGKRSLSVLEQHISNTLPLLGIIAAGYPLDVFENVDYIDIPASFAHPDNYALQVSGSSMIDDNIQDGDIVIIQKAETANQGETIVAYVNEEATLKRYYPTKNGIELHPKNEDFDIIHVKPEDDFRIGGIVLGVIRKY